MIASHEKDEAMSTLVFDRELDCKGLNCPLPIFKTKQAIDTLQVGQVLRMVATDPGSVKDMEAWSRQTGNRVIDQQVEDDIYIFYVEKA